MAFDAVMLSAIVREIRDVAEGARVEKVQQPERDEIVLQMHGSGGKCRLLISAAANRPRMQLTDQIRENPQVPPMFCMLLRKYLTGAKLLEVKQEGLERVARFRFSCRDEMGFSSERFLLAEIMGQYSNMILCDAADKILGVLRPIDFATSSKRQLLPGMRYELPPPQNKKDPFAETKEGFLASRAQAGDMENHSFLLKTYAGFSPLLAREIACGIGADEGQRLWESFQSELHRITSGDFQPTMLREPNGSAAEFYVHPLKQYGNRLEQMEYPSFRKLLDDFFEKCDRENRIRQRASDLFRLLNHAETRLKKKMALQQGDLAACKEKERWKELGDLVTANIWKLKRGMTEVMLTDYSRETMPEVPVTLDGRLTPAQNAAMYYKKYNKARSAERELTKQLALAQRDLAYVETVLDALTRAEGENDLEEIRAELYETGFASKMKQYVPGHKRRQSEPSRFLSSGGFEILCGRSNTQNDRLTCRMAGKQDYWFHVKNLPGSHVILICPEGKTPSEQDMTEAAMIAAAHSKGAAGGVQIPVDYTQVRYVKKPSGSKPGFVTYSANRTAYVTPDEALLRRLRKT